MAMHYCPSCETEREFVARRQTDTYDVRGLKVELPIEVEVCATCGEELFDEQRDARLLREAYAAYRRQKGLLFPHEIGEIRDRYALSQKSFAALLGMSEATINRYEQGGLQEETQDNTIRLADKPDAILSLLERRGHLLSNWQRERAEQAALSQLRAQLRPATRFQPLGPSEVTGGRAFDQERYAAAVLWFCHKLGGVLRTKLNKLLFYADFLCHKETGRSLTGTTYRRLAYGPVPVDYGSLEEALEDEGVIQVEQGTFSEGYEYVRVLAGPASWDVHVEFSENERAVLEHVAQTFHDLGSVAISERSHREPAWKDTPEKNLISYRHAASLSLSLDD
ncbi:MAG: DUF4065 domain-containing protein [Phycisphaerae bacterium]|jgi:putative zinc finger/helix-turn-helix YgiT family protein